jgi:hypothetical protein
VSLDDLDIIPQWGINGYHMNRHSAIEVSTIISQADRPSLMDQLATGPAGPELSQAREIITLRLSLPDPLYKNASWMQQSYTKLRSPGSIR